MDGVDKCMCKENVYVEKGVLEKDRIRKWDPGSYTLLWLFGSVTLTKNFTLSYKIIFGCKGKFLCKWDYLWNESAACQALLSMKSSRQEYWSGKPFPSPGDLPNQWIEPRFPALQTESLLSDTKEAQ